MPVNETLGILAHAGVRSDQDRHLMMPSPPIRPRSDPSHSRRISTGIAPLASARQIGPHRQRHSGQQTPGPLVQPCKDTHALGQAMGSTASRHSL
jgi:hypothetical protein